MADIWSGLAYLLAELIEKHASEINLDGLPTFHIENDKIVNSVNIGDSVDKESAA